MSIEYSLTITRLQTLNDYQGYSGVVCAVDWSYTGTDGAFAMSVTGTTPLNLDLGCEITPYEALPEATVIGWVYRDTNPEVWLTAQQQITAWLHEQYALVAVVRDPPWVGGN
jgi:hypothetical protein